MHLPRAELVGSTAHYLGLMSAAIGELGQADRNFAVADDAHARAGSPVWQAHTQLAWGRLLVDGDRPRDPKRGHRLLEEAYGTAKRVGMAGVERRARSAGERSSGRDS